MEAVLNLNYSQILALLKQLLARTRLRLGRELTREATRSELEHFLEVFRTDDITDEEILGEVKQVRRSRHGRHKEQADNR